MCINFLLVSCLSILVHSKKYEPNWDSLDSRPLPSWYDKSKFGIFMHWSVWSVPSYGPKGAGEAAFFWPNWKTNKNKNIIKFMNDNYRPNFTYQDFAAQFQAEFFDAARFAKIIKGSGAKYFVFTSKHCEGYAMWPSKYSWNWNSLDVGPHRDIVKELRDAIINVGGVHFGLYFSQMDWFSPLYLSDKRNKFSTNEYAQATSIPQMYELVNSYKPEIFWSDAEWEAPPSYWNSTGFLAWLYNESPVKDTVVTNDRWGSGTQCHHGGYLTCTDKFDPGHLIPRKWENCMTTDSGSWGFRRNMEYRDVLSVEQLIEELARAIRYTSKLRSTVNTSEDQIYYAQSYANSIVYAFLLNWPKSNQLVLGATVPTSTTKVTMLGYDDLIEFKLEKNGISIDLSGIKWKQLPSLWAWVFKIQYLKSSSRVPTLGKYKIP